MLSLQVHFALFKERPPAGLWKWCSKDSQDFQSEGNECINIRARNRSEKREVVVHGMMLRVTTGVRPAVKVGVQKGMKLGAKLGVKATARRAAKAGVRITR